MTTIPDPPTGRPAADVAPDSIAVLSTEVASVEFADLDQMDALGIVTAMNRQDRTVPEAIAAHLPAIAEAAETAYRSLRAGGRLIDVGCGTAGRMGVLDASECPPTFGSDPASVLGIIAGGDVALRTAVEGSEDDEAAGIAAMDEVGAGPHDTVVGIAASGRTPYTVSALARARERGAHTIALACTIGSPLAAQADLALEVVTGPEVIAGSTRLKAGTAQKLVLNMISSAAMVRLGKTYGNRMVDVQATNAKLRARAISIVADIAEVDHPTARDALTEADGHAKTACLMLLAHCTVEEAHRLLDLADGNLRRALTSALPPSPTHH